MLALTKKTEYALIALAKLARSEADWISAREIARRSGIGLATVTAILKRLAAAEFVVSARGATGGYGLARPLESISLHELLTAIEGPFQFVQCVSAEDGEETGSCDLEGSCPIRHATHRIHRKLKTFLENVSLAEVLQESPDGDSPLDDVGPIRIRRAGATA